MNRKPYTYRPGESPLIDAILKRQKLEEESTPEAIHQRAERIANELFPPEFIQNLTANILQALPTITSTTAERS